MQWLANVVGTEGHHTEPEAVWGYRRHPREPQSLELGEQNMPTTKIYLPEQWTDWTTWLLGIWLCLSPWTLLFEFEATAMRNAVLLGVLVILIELVELSIFSGWEEWINVALGAWLIA